MVKVRRNTSMAGLLLVLICGAGSSYADHGGERQLLATSAEAKALCANSAALFARNKINSAFDVVKPYWPWDAQELTAVAEQGKAQLAGLEQRFGKALVAEYIGQRTAGDSLVEFAYLIKFEKHALRYLCTFYKPRELWKLNAITWDDDLQSLLR